MGKVDDLSGHHLYLDTNVFIYAKEGVAEHLAVARALFALIDQGACTASTSELSLAEALVMPIRTGDPRQQEEYAAMVTTSGHLSVRPITRDLLVAAAGLRASNPTIQASRRHPCRNRATGWLLPLRDERRPLSDSHGNRRGDSQ